MLKRLYVDYHKCLVSFALPLDELTLLLGVDGGGANRRCSRLYSPFASC